MSQNNNNTNNPPMIQLSPNVNPDECDDQYPTVSALAASGTILAASRLDGEVALFETSEFFGNSNQNNNAKPFQVFRAHNDSLNCCRFLSDKHGGGAFLATCSDDSSVRIFDCKNMNDTNRGYPVALYPAPSEVNCIAESTDGKSLYAGCDDGSVVTYTIGVITDARTLNNTNSNNTNSNNNNIEGSDYNSLNPFPQASPPLKIDRFMVGEGSVNDIIVVNLPYGDLIFTATDDGCLRAWRTQPGQRAPNEPAANLPSQQEIDQQINEAANENDNDNDNNNNNNTDDTSAQVLREMISEQLGNEAANRLITSFDVLKGAQINHIVSTTIGNEPVLLIAASTHIFAVAFNVATGQLSEEPMILFSGNEDFVRGVHPLGGMNNNNNNNNNNSPTFLTVADDGVVCSFPRSLQNQQEAVGPEKKFQAEQQGLNIMSSVVLNNGKVLATGSLLGSVKLWNLE